MPFIVPGNQMYLPMLAIDLREHFRRMREEVPAFSPATQAVVIRRIGYLLEQEAAPQPFLCRLRKALATSSSLIPWIPNAPKRGRANERWGVVANSGGNGQ